MRRALLASLLAVLAAASLTAGSLYVLELKGGARVFALDHPVQKGRVVLFHRHPDGIYTSISADEVVKIAAASSTDRTEQLQPGEAMLLGGKAEGAKAQRIAPGSKAPADLPPYQPREYTYSIDFGPAWGIFPPNYSPPILGRPNLIRIFPSDLPALAPPRFSIPK